MDLFISYFFLIPGSHKSSSFSVDTILVWFSWSLISELDLCLLLLYLEFSIFTWYLFSSRKHSSKGVNIFGTAPLVYAILVLITLEKYNNVCKQRFGWKTRSLFKWSPRSMVNFLEILHLPFIFTVRYKSW